MKQINKANQMINEKIGGAKGTEIDHQYQAMEKKTDTINKLIEDVRERTYEYLQPNPASRARLALSNNLCKMRGQAKTNPYPQPEGVLGESMIKHGKELGDESNFGNALIDVGESLRQMAGIKYALEDNIKQNFLDPLSQIKDNDIKEVMHLRKKTESRRLDYDCKKRKKSQGSIINEEDLQQAEIKFEESKNQSEVVMKRLLRNETEQVTHLLGFAEGFLEYHSQCADILKEMVNNLNKRKQQISNRQSSISENSWSNSSNGKIKPGSLGFDSEKPPLYNSQPSEMPDINNFYPPENGLKMPMPMPTLPPKSENNSSSSTNKIPFDFSSLIQNSFQPPQPSNQRSPSAKALYDFEAENEEELDFKEGQTIKLLARLDENWLEGEINGRKGRFPTSYVEIIVPLP